MDNRCKVSQVESLLKILKPAIPSLPLSQKTFLNTKKLDPFVVKPFGENAKFVYFGIRRSLRKIINVDLHKDLKIILQFNVDGLPLFKSSSFEFWPILGYVLYRPAVYKPFPVAIYCGKGKPKDLALFLDEFISEFNSILREGVEIDGQVFTVNFMGLVNDLPARAFLKNVKGHAGFHGCERCDIA